MSLVQIANKTKIHRPIIWAVSLFFLLTITVLLVYAAESTYDFVGVTSPSSGDVAYEEYPEDGFSGPTDQGEGEATNTDYDNIKSDNGVRWEIAGATSDGEYDSQLYKFFVSENESTISQLDFKWNGYGETTSDYNTTLYAWDYDNPAWVQLDQVDFTVATDQDITHSESADPGKFVDTDGAVTLMVKTKKYVEPEFCSVPTDYKTTKTIEENIVYCDADGEMWTETASSTYAWNSSGSGSCGEACTYCNDLSYAGYDDWYLPTCTNDDDLPDSCQLYQFGVDNCDWTGTESESSCTPDWDTSAAASTYWSSTEYISTNAWVVYFWVGNVGASKKDSTNVYLRCVR